LVKSEITGKEVRKISEETEQNWKEFIIRINRKRYANRKQRNTQINII
jgi:hypothetical protein